MLSHTPKDITEVFEKSNIAWCMNIPKVTTERRSCPCSLRLNTRGLRGDRHRSKEVPSIGPS